MAEPDYFQNHVTAHTWPFSLYHSSILRRTKTFLPEYGAGANCLNIGCGFFDSYPDLKYLGRWHACDVDQRCLDTVSQRYPEVETTLCGQMPELRGGPFDIIIATEVIEHVKNPLEWLRQVFSLAGSGATAVFSTPNYGISLLPLVEYTLLQLIAMRKGFSRFSLHPNKYSRRKMLSHLSHAAGPGAKITVKRCAFGMALVGAVKLGNSGQ